MAEKVTIMVLNVDLQCSRCYKKVKKVLSKFPQIRDQVYDKEANTVTITVVCCSPEKFRDKLCCKGGGSITSIVIKPPPKPKEPEKNDLKPKDCKEKIKQPCKKPEPTEPQPKPTGSPPPVAHPLIRSCYTECYHGHGEGPCTECYHGHGQKPPIEFCYTECYHDQPEKIDEKPKECKEKIQEPCTEKIKQPCEKPEPIKPPQKPTGCPPPVAYPPIGSCCTGQCGGCCTECYHRHGQKPPIGFCCIECYHGHGGGPCYEPRPPAPPPCRPIGFCCTECYRGHGGGPCHFGRPPPPSCSCYCRPVYDSCSCGCGSGSYGCGCGCGSGSYGCGCGCGGCQYYYASKENPQACLIM